MTAFPLGHFRLRLVSFAGSGRLPCRILAGTALALACGASLAQERAGSVEEVLVVATPDHALAELKRSPGGVALVRDTAFINTPVQHMKDMLDYVPGLITQTRMGDDARVSIRGSGLSRAYGARGIALSLDGLPLNTSDGLVDFFEIDPSAYRYVEVFKGANALRYGANALGGAINLVTPTAGEAAASGGRIDAGSFGYVKAQASSTGVSGERDYFATLSVQRSDGYREHSEGHALRAHLNVGYRLSPVVETRFYANAVSTEQRIPGEVSYSQALNTPRAANPEWVLQDQQRNVDSLRVANKTTFRLDQTTVELAAFYNHRRVDHPIYQYLDYSVDDYGGFVRAVDERWWGGMRNRLTLGANLHNGAIDTEQFINLAGAVKGDLAASMRDESRNISLYAEDSLFLRGDLALVAGLQYLNASRDRRDRFLVDGDQSGNKDYDLWSPKFGVLWDVGADWQLFANISRSAEIPSYDANIFTSPANAELRAQRATTYEVGTRGSSGALAWDLALYRAELRNELQCLTTAPWSPCSIINADRTVHQGVEAGIAVQHDSVALNLAYTYNDFFFAGDTHYGDNRLPGVPRHLVRAELVYRHASGFHIGPNLEWAPGHYYADNANTLSVAPYALLNIKVGYEVAERWSVYLEGRNLSDRAYISTVAVAGVADADSELFNPGTGRAVFAGLRLEW